MVGAFHQPLRVVCDLSTLDSLPDRELKAGLAEVIKYGPIADLTLLAWLEANMQALLDRDRSALSHAVRRSCEIKALVVGQDERESGLRAILNFGHTFGHAIEAGMGYGQWLHGEAVACGMVLASDLSAELGLIKPAFAERLRALVARAGLPVQAPALPLDRWFELMSVDKKAASGDIRYVLLNEPGQAIVSAAPQDVVARVIQRHSPPGAGA
jgi:3-dehydroquinate synthase